jgi:hypothetical protein
LHCAGIEPATSCVVGEYSHDYATSAVKLILLILIVPEEKVSTIYCKVISGYAYYYSPFLRCRIADSLRSLPDIYIQACISMVLGK